MEIILFIGIPAVGKSTFYQERFAGSHVRINRDMLKTAARTKSLFDWCLEHRQSCVIDNTNTTRAVRAEWINAARAKGIRLAGYFFESKLEGALERNRQRIGEQRIPDVGVRDHHARLELPCYEEGFSSLFFVRLATVGFELENWKNDV